MGNRPVVPRKQFLLLWDSQKLRVRVVHPVGHAGGLPGGRAEQRAVEGIPWGWPRQGFAAQLQSCLLLADGLEVGMLQQMPGLQPPLARSKALLDEASQLRTLDGFQRLRRDALETHIHNVLDRRGVQRHTHAC